MLRIHVGSDETKLRLKTMKPQLFFPLVLASSFAASILRGGGVNDTPCLCIFDVDRTLTGAQGSAASTCKGADKEISGVSDTAYGGGTLTISALAQGLSGTFCDSCSLALCSAGNAAVESKERNYILNNVLGGSSRVGGASAWDDDGAQGGKVTSPLVTRQRDGQKQDAAKAIVDWYTNNAQITFDPSNVYFFDDRADNVSPFAGTGFNAHQVSCATRDSSSGGLVGLCGATASEIVRKSGISTCSSVPKLATE